jgi:multicomponent Na+:H+ antiporter subunit G
MTALEWTTVALLTAGSFFFFAGTLGLLRFPDTHSRLHALTKADNVGLGFVVAALSLQADGVATVLKLVLIWLLALLASATSAYLIADHASTAAGVGTPHDTNPARPQDDAG